MMSPEAEPQPPASKHKLRWYQYSLRTLMLIVTLVAVLLGLYYWTMTVNVCEVPPDTPVAERYFGFVHAEVYHRPLTAKDIRPRNIACVSGRFFARGPYLSAALYLVDAGKVTEINSLSLGHSSSVIPSGLGEYLKITFALGDADTPDGRVTLLGSVGETRGAGRGGPCRHKVKASAHALLTGRVERGEARVVYAEGDQPPVVTFGMDINDFAARNRGSYLVVTMGLK